MSAADTLLAFDFGRRYIGVAIGQTITATANPLTVIRSIATGPDWNAISRLFQDWQPDAAIVGLPLNMDGSSQWISIQAQRFARQLHGRYKRPVYLCDERLSTREARQRQALTPPRHRQSDHAIAAQIILEGWMEDRQSTVVPE